MTTAITRTCPDWCEEHVVLEPAVLGLDEMPEQHNSRTLAWSDSGRLSAFLTTIGDTLPQLEIDGTDSALMTDATPAELRRLAAALVTLAERMEVGR